MSPVHQGGSPDARRDQARKSAPRRKHFLSRFAVHSAIMARMFARTPIFANSARYFVEPLAFGGLVLAVLVLAARGRDFSDILPNLGVMALAGYRLLPSLQLIYAQLTQVSTMRHAVDEVYDEFVAAETDRSVAAVTSAEPVRLRILFAGILRSHCMK